MNRKLKQRSAAHRSPGLARFLRRWATSLWPGVPQLLDTGSVSSLACAVLFTALFNGLLCITLLWPGTLSFASKVVFGTVVLVVWFGFFWRNLQYEPRGDFGAEGAALDLFLEAREEYLRGELISTEQKLLEVLSQHPEDVCARLMVVSVLRRQGKVGEAREQLRRLQRWKAASHWQLEIRREWELLAKREYRASVSNVSSIVSVGSAGISDPQASSRQVRKAA